MNLNSDPLLENLISQLGEFGSYQLIQTALFSLSSFLTGIHIFGFTFATTIPKHRCFIPGLDSSDSSNYTWRNDPSILESYIEKDAYGNFESCSRIENGTRLGCEGQFVFEGKYHSSKVIEWGLVCDDKWKLTFLHFSFIFGILNGAVVLSMLSDRFGRKIVFYASGVGQLLTAFTVAFITNYNAYIIVLFMYGAFGAGTFIPGLTTITEIVGPLKRAYCGTLYCLAFTSGGMLAGLWAFLIHNYLELLQTIYSLHSILLIGHWWLIDESPRWLWAKGRTLEAISIVKKGVEWNGKHLINNYQSGRPEESSAVSISTNPYFTDLLLTPNLRGRALSLSFNWVANSLLLSALSLSLPGREPLFLSFLNVLLQFPGYLIVIGLVDRTGRRSLSSLLLFLSGFATILLPLLPKGGLLVTGISILGKSLIAGSLAVMVTYTAELFPTIVRGSGLGVCGFGTGAAGILISQIISLNSEGIGGGYYVMFGMVGILAAIFALFLPETLGKELPGSLEDGENFGRGDNAFKTLSRAINRRRFKEDGTRFQLQNHF